MKSWCWLGLVAMAGCQAVEAEGALPSAVAARAAAALESSPVAVDASLARTGLSIEQERLLALQRVWQTRIAVAMDNLANVNTPGFKRRIVLTESLPPQTLQAPGLSQRQGGAAAPVGIQVGAGVGVVGVSPVFTPGVLEVTDRNLDVAIDGAGMFAVQLRDGGTGYTRNGTLQLNRNGELVTAAGDLLIPQITVPADLLEINIDPEGRVTGRTAGSPDTSTNFGQLLVHRFMNHRGLLDDGGGIWRMSDASGRPTTATPGANGLGYLKQGFLERSNVEVQRELARVKTAREQFAAISRVLGL